MSCVSSRTPTMIVASVAMYLGTFGRTIPGKDGKYGDSSKTRIAETASLHHGLMIIRYSVRMKMEEYLQPKKSKNSLEAWKNGRSTFIPRVMVSGFNPSSMADSLPLVTKICIQ